jgi:hypothetical protein
MVPLATTAHMCALHASCTPATRQPHACCTPAARLLHACFQASFQLSHANEGVGSGRRGSGGPFAGADRRLLRGEPALHAGLGHAGLGAGCARCPGCMLAMLRGAHRGPRSGSAGHGIRLQQLVALLLPVCQQQGSAPKERLVKAMGHILPLLAQLPCQAGPPRLPLMHLAGQFMESALILSCGLPLVLLCPRAACNMGTSYS